MSSCIKPKFKSILLFFQPASYVAVCLERWCRLRGNLLFYFKSSDQFSEPQGVIVLEKCEPVIRNEKKEQDGYVFYIGKCLSCAHLT